MASSSSARSLSATLVRAIPSVKLGSALMSTPTYVNPDTLADPRGYSNGVVYPAGRILFVAGQIGWRKDGTFVDGMAPQFAIALANVLEVVRAAGGSPEHI